MTELFWVVWAIVLGVTLSFSLGGFAALRPRWGGILVASGAGAAGGIGLSALFYFIGVLRGSATLAIAMEMTAIFGGAFLAWKRRWPRTAEVSESRGLKLTFAAAVALLLVIVTLAFAAAWQSNPQGNWDAWAIWNMRARYLAAGDGFAARAWSPVLGAASHPEYPLLLSSFIASCWAFSHSVSELAPIATGYAFFLALIAMVTGGVAALRGPIMGLAAGLVLLASPALLREAPAQYADVPLACYMAGAVLLAMLDRPVFAGILAGFAAWTKDEGLLFLAIFLVVSAVIKRRAAILALAGALPVALVAVAFKLSLPKLATSFTGVNGGGLASRAADFSRVGIILAAFGREIAAMSTSWYHPVLPLIALGVACGLERERLRAAVYSGSVALLLLLGYFGAFLVTGYDLKWQLDTALGRLLVQVWPLIVITAVAAMRAPKLAAAPAPKAQKKISGRR